MSALAELRLELVEALDDFDRTRTTEVVQRVVRYLDAAAEPADERTAAGLLSDLRRTRHHDLAVQVAEALIRNGTDRAAVRLRYVQALLDQGMDGAGIAMAERLLARVDPASGDGVEIRGLLGRAYKDMALDLAEPGRRAAALRRAVDIYLGPYREDASRWWHGINACALLALAEREGIAHSGNPDAKDLGAEILAAIVSGAGLEAWDHATAMEAALATGDADAATAWLMSYLAEARGDAFALGSTLRQLTEVWQLRPDTPPGAQLVAPLQAALLRAEGGAVEVPAKEWRAGIADTGYEALFGRERYQDLVWFQRALDRCRAVGRIDDQGGDAAGTGFLVEPEPLGVRGEPFLFVTNSHVISQHGLAALSPDQATVTFTALDAEPGQFRVERVVWESPPDELDCTMVALSGPSTCGHGLALTTSPPVLSEQRRQRAYVIGHPAGKRQPRFSIRDNFLLDLDDRLVHYRSPTEPGSSGSPVFNEEWDIFALHHRGHPQMPRLHGRSGTYEANEGIRIDAIVTACRQAIG
jgi:V8-like Glu-specific endopeptidase